MTEIPMIETGSAYQAGVSNIRILDLFRISCFGFRVFSLVCWSFLPPASGPVVFKSEIRNPKLETNPNDQNPNDRNGQRVSSRRFEHLDLGFVSDFVLQISGFLSGLLVVSPAR